MHHYILHIPTEQIPITRTPGRIVDGHIDDGFQLIAHGIQHEGNTARFRLEQIAER
ncbi:hypothetical protein D3C87_2082280 [compost metagenome]